ncbi:MAG: hypothetical protein WCV69_01990 [Patescibacteria group bacterium]
MDEQAFIGIVINFIAKGKFLSKIKARHLNPCDGGSGGPWKERGGEMLALTVGWSAVGRGNDDLFPGVVGRDVKKDGQEHKVAGGREVAYSACHRLGRGQYYAGEEKKPAEPQKNQRNHHWPPCWPDVLGMFMMARKTIC